MRATNNREREKAQEQQSIRGALLIETYSAERQAEFLLSNSTNEQEYQEARSEVLLMGLNPDKITHIKP